MKTNIQKQMVLMASGTYTGNDTDNRAIPHGLGRKPKIVFIRTDNAAQLMGQMTGSDEWFGNIHTAQTVMDSTNFYVGLVGATYAATMNAAGANYYWVALA